MGNEQQQAARKKEFLWDAALLNGCEQGNGRRAALFICFKELDVIFYELDWQKFKDIVNFKQISLHDLDYELAVFGRV